MCIKSDDENDGQDNNMINEANSEEAQAPQRKRKKMEEPMFNCPMCDRKFIESEINQHAFTCNAEPLRESRSQTKRYFGFNLSCQCTICTSFIYVHIKFVYDHSNLASGLQIKPRFPLIFCFFFSKAIYPNSNIEIFMLSCT